MTKFVLSVIPLKMGRTHFLMPKSLEQFCHRAAQTMHLSNLRAAAVGNRNVRSFDIVVSLDYSPELTLVKPPATERFTADSL